MLKWTFAGYTITSRTVGPTVQIKMKHIKYQQHKMITDNYYSLTK